MLDKEAKVKNFWTEQADKPDADMSSPDTIAQMLELESLYKVIPENTTLLDAGCGNGWKLQQIMDNKNGINAVGFDYSEALVNAAVTRFSTSQHADKARFLCGSVYDEPWGNRQFDTVLSSRMIINLTDAEKQLMAISKLWRAVAPGGQMLLLESGLIGLANINKIREAMGLVPISPHWHNNYMTSAVIEYILQIGVKREVIAVNDLYYFTSRTVNACQNNARYDSEINMAVAVLPQDIKKDVSPLKLYRIRKAA